MLDDFVHDNHGCVNCKKKVMTFPKIPPNSNNKPRGLYFSKALFEGLIFRGAYLRREIGLASQKEVNFPFLLCFTLYLRAIFQVQAPAALTFGGVI